MKVSDLDPITELPGHKSPKFMYSKKLWYFLRAKPDLQLSGSKN
jgi:hypothetical protein